MPEVEAEVPFPEPEGTAMMPSGPPPPTPPNPSEPNRIPDPPRCGGPLGALFVLLAASSLFAVHLISTLIPNPK